MARGIITYVTTARSEVYVRLQATYVERLGVHVGSSSQWITSDVPIA